MLDAKWGMNKEIKDRITPVCALPPYANWACNLSAAAPCVCHSFICALYSLLYCCLLRSSITIRLSFSKETWWWSLKGGKRFLYSHPHKEPSCQVQASQPSRTSLLLWPRVLQWDTFLQLTVDMWVFALHFKPTHLICLYVAHMTRFICNYYLPKVFSRRRETKERGEEQATVCISMGKTYVGTDVTDQLHRSTCKRWSDYQVKNVHLP